MRWKYLVPLAVFLVLCGFLFKGLYLDPRKVPSALIDKPAPEFVLPQLDEAAPEMKKADLLGRVYLMNVWASWCESCRYEHPFLNELKRRGEKVVIVGYNYRDERADARRWLAVLGNPYDYCLYDRKGSEAINFGVYGAPETFVIDKKGVIRHKVIGPMSEKVWKSEVAPLVRKLEAE